MSCPCIKLSYQLLRVEDDVELCHEFIDEAQVEQAIVSKMQTASGPNNAKGPQWFESGMAFVYKKASKGKKKRWYLGGGPSVLPNK